MQDEVICAIVEIIVTSFYMRTLCCQWLITFRNFSGLVQISFYFKSLNQNGPFYFNLRRMEKYYVSQI